MLESLDQNQVSEPEAVTISLESQFVFLLSGAINLKIQNLDQKKYYCSRTKARKVQGID